MILKKNDRVIVEIIDYTVSGSGVGKVNNFPIFVKNSTIHDKVEIVITKVLKTYGYGKIINIIKPSEFRIKEKCEVGKTCGGCTMMATSYEKQLEVKENFIINSLTRIGGENKEDLFLKKDNIIGMDNPMRYRNKSQYPVRSDKDGNIIVGFFRENSHNIVEVRDCLIGNEIDKEIINRAKEWMIAFNIKAYDETSNKGDIRHILLRHGSKEVENNRIDSHMVCLIINNKKDKDKIDYKPLIEELKKVVNIDSISISYNNVKNNVIMGDNFDTIYGSDNIEEKIGDYRFLISPLSFFQVNTIQVEKLYKRAKEYLELITNKINSNNSKIKIRLWDLYCGTGTIGIYFSDKVDAIIGVEVIEEAIINARENAIRNNVKNAKYYVGEAEVVTSNILKDSIGDFNDIVVLDPPRKGCDKKLLDTVININPLGIVYISCDPATLGRDLKYLRENSEYRIERFTGVDMFPWTGHVETVVLLTKVHN